MNDEEKTWAEKEHVFMMKDPTDKKIKEACKAFIEETNQKHNTYGYNFVFLGFEVTRYEKASPKANLRDIAHYGQHFAYKIAPDDVEINKNENQCVIDCIAAAMKNVYSTFSRQSLVDYFQKKLNRICGISIREVIDWVQTRKDVSFYALDPFRQVIMHHVAQHCKVVISTLCNDKHAFPITDAAMKDRISRTKALNVEKTSLEIVDYSNHTFWDCTGDIPPGKVVVCDACDLSVIAKRVITETKMYVTHMSFTRAELTCFMHPVTEQFFVASIDYKLRKELLARWFAETKYVGYDFRNQSWSKIAMDKFEFDNGVIPRSQYGPDLIRVFRSYRTRPFIGQFDVVR